MVSVKSFHRPRQARSAVLLILIFLISGIPVSNESGQADIDDSVEWLRFDLPDDSIRNLVGQLDQTLSMEERPLLAHSRLGVHDA